MQDSKAVKTVQKQSEHTRRSIGDSHFERGKKYLLQAHSQYSLRRARYFMERAQDAGIDKAGSALTAIHRLEQRLKMDIFSVSTKPH